MNRLFFCVAALTALVVMGCSTEEAEVVEPESAEAVGPEVPEVVAEDESPVVRDVKQRMADNEPFSFDFTLPDLEGKPVTKAEFDGKVLIVDVWGTWCPPCRAEIPHFIALQDKYADQGLAIVGLNYESGSPEEIKQTVSSFVEANGINYTCLLGDEVTKSQIPGFRGFPTTLFLDRNGLVRLKLVGLQDPEVLEAVVTTLLAE